MTKAQSKKLIMVTSIGVIMSGCAATHDVVGRYQSFKSLDVNEDNLISPREAESLPAISKSFRRIDTDSNSNISKTEYKAASTRLAQFNFKHLDFNNDGVLSRQEANAVRPSLNEKFNRVDADGDDNVSFAEYNAATINLLHGLKFYNVDRDGDGVIDKAEAKVNPTLHNEFKAIDINDDEIISKSEFLWAQQL